jgi:hypothetical protein
VLAGSLSSLGFPAASPALEVFGLKFSSGGAHISRTMMLAELEAVLGGGSCWLRCRIGYREAIVDRNVLGKKDGQHPAEIAASLARAVCDG